MIDFPKGDLSKSVCTERIFNLLNSFFEFECNLSIQMSGALP